MTLKVIETRYKGYRFRSRLEARWAVVFDAMGWSWRYEDEGYDVNGRWYLPDFVVDWPISKGHTVKTIIEIKPHRSPASVPPKVYMAGAMGMDRAKEDGWLGYRAGLYKGGRKYQSWKDYKYEYIGPNGNHNVGERTKYYFQGHDLDDSEDYPIEEQISWILGRRKAEIESCDVFLLYIQKTKQQMYLVELGMAISLHKPIYIAGNDDICNDIGKSILPILCTYDNCAFKIGEKEDAIEWLLDCAGAKLKEPDEINLLRNLTINGSPRVAALYGTPGEHEEVFPDADFMRFGFTKHALERGRSARFEHGERG